MRLFYFIYIGGNYIRPHICAQVQFAKGSCEEVPCSHFGSSVLSSIKIVAELLHVLCAFFINSILMSDMLEYIINNKGYHKNCNKTSLDHIFIILDPTGTSAITELLLLLQLSYLSNVETTLTVVLILNLL